MSSIRAIKEQANKDNIALAKTFKVGQTAYINLSFGEYRVIKVKAIDTTNKNLVGWKGNLVYGPDNRTVLASNCFKTLEELRKKTHPRYQLVESN